MRLNVALEAFLHWRQVERGAPPRSIESYRAILEKLVDRYPVASLADFDGKAGTELLRTFLERWADRSASTRCNAISVVHSFFAWAVAEELIDTDPSRRIRRPPKRKPRITRPSPEQLARLRAAANLHELPTILLLEGSGLRNSEVRACRWEHIDLVRGRVHVLRKGQHWQWLPIAPDVLAELRRCSERLDPEPDDHVFTVEVERWVSDVERVRYRLDPKHPASSQALGRMVKRVCRRARIAPISPHGLRHGFANRFLRESGRDLVSLQVLLGHARPETTKDYTDELDVEELATALAHAVAARVEAVTSGAGQNALS
jgi:integrase/recombinase XerC